VPHAWVAQTRAGGLVCAVLPYGLVRLRVGPDGSSVGRFHPTHFTFMEMRGTHPTSESLPVAELFALARADGKARPTSVDGAGMPLRSALWMLVLIVAVPSLAVLDLGDGAYGFVDPDSRSWARVESGVVVEGGPKRIWTTVESINGRWQAAGAPERPEIGLTITADGHQYIWLCSPDSDYRWELR
jgi:hypothetical protein